MKAGKTILLLLTLYASAQTLSVTGQSVSGQVNSYFAVSAIDVTANSITVDNASGLGPGQRVLLIQSKGASIATSNTAAFGDLSAIGGAGFYEFNIICQVTANVVVLKEPLLHSYDVSGAVQLVSVPSYGSVIVGGTVTAAPWDPAAGKGGVVVIEASGTIFLNADIDVSGQGLTGGALVNYPTPTYDCAWNVTVNGYALNMPASGDYTGGKKGEGIAAYATNMEYGQGKQGNGGGGGNNANTGGAGGGNYGTGGAGGRRAGEAWYLCHGASPGIGGLSLSSQGYTTGNNRVFFGGGGGSGHENNGVGLPGGNGGGIIILSAGTITGGGGQLLARGLAPVNAACVDPYQAEGDGGGGGGAGGTILVNASVIGGSAITTDVSGARGSDASNRVNDCTGPGGGGGGGVVWVSGGSLPGGISVLATGGSNGVVSAGNSLASCRGLANGATAGGAGAALTGLVLPESSGNVCVPLAVTALRYFRGMPLNAGFALSWALSDTTGVRQYTIERSADQLQYNALATLEPAVSNYTDDGTVYGTVYYRLVWTDADGMRYYSQVVPWTHELRMAGLLDIHPNPVIDRLSVNCYATSGTAATLRIYNAQGYLLHTQPCILRAGSTSFSLAVRDLPAATYFLVFECDGRRTVKPFIKK